jgi:hypothetical protein
MRRINAFLPELSPLSHTEAVLFVNYNESKIAELNILFN